MFGLGMGEIVIVLVVVLLLFGGKKLPQLGSALGQAMTNFKKGLGDGKKELEDEKKKSNLDNDINKDS
jgi:sec-independent protein translocase protein TatA